MGRIERMMVMIMSVMVIFWVESSEGGELLCSYCQVAVGEIEKELQASNNNITAAEVEHKLLPLCSNFSFAKRAKCKATISAVVPVILSDLEGQENPLALCGSLTFCNVSQSALCHRCQVGLKAAEAKLRASNASDAQIVAQLLPLCQQLPNASDVSLCVAALRLVGPRVIDLLRSGVSPTNLCGDLHLCIVSHPPPSTDFVSSFDDDRQEEEKGEDGFSSDSSFSSSSSIPIA